MKLLILSDSHGHLDNMIQAVELESPHMILHLGDCWRDAERLHDHFPETPLHQVPGNCDFRSTEPTEQILCIKDYRILLCHGHTYGVKSSLIAAGYAAEEQNLDVFLFGHTHRPLVDKRGKTWFLNPGSIGDARYPTYGIVTIENGTLEAHTVALKQH